MKLFLKASHLGPKVKLFLITPKYQTLTDNKISIWKTIYFKHWYPITILETRSAVVAFKCLTSSSFTLKSFSLFSHVLPCQFLSISTDGAALLTSPTDHCLHFPISAMILMWMLTCTPGLNWESTPPSVLLALMLTDSPSFCSSCF